MSSTSSLDAAPATSMTSATAPVASPKDDAATASSAPSAEMAEAPAPQDPPLPSVDLGVFAHELSEPVVSLALGEQRAAALGEEPWLQEKGKWRKISFPERLRPESGAHDARIFFGRDDKPRIMGARRRDGQVAQLYLRYRFEKWIEERNEVAKLLEAPPQPLFGILGHADPEVACKVGSLCIIKRRTGWKTMPPGPGAPRVELHEGVPWALYPDAIARLDGDQRWLTVGAPAPFHAPGGVYAAGRELWVSEPAAGKLHHHDGQGWRSLSAPVSGPRGMWGTGPHDVWLAGDGGLVHFDGSSWKRVAGVEGPVAEVYGRGEEIWAAGGAGVWSRREAPR